MTKQEVLDLLEERRRFYEAIENNWDKDTTTKDRYMGEAAKWACIELQRDIEKMEG